MIARVDGSNASKTVIWPLLLGIGSLLVLVVLLAKDENKGTRACSTVPAAVLASNPNLTRSYQIEKAKKECIKERICNPELLVGYDPCEFTAYNLKECKDLDPALADYKTARRHLDAEVETCELSKVVGRHGETVYQWRERS
jgi:hypothetical protein